MWVAGRGATALWYAIVTPNVIVCVKYSNSNLLSAGYYAQNKNMVRIKQKYMVNIRTKLENKSKD